MKIGALRLYRAAPNGGIRLLAGIEPGKPALRFSSSYIGKAVPRVARPSRLTGRQAFPESRRHSLALVSMEAAGQNR
jgi:hypothetical protein